MEMREGNLWKKILIYSVPLMLTNLLQVFFNLADVAIVGKFSGPIALGGVGSTTLLITLTTGLLIGIASGINALTALFIGADDVLAVKKCVHTGFIVCLVTGILVLLVGLTLSNSILSLMGTKPELMSEALRYFRIYMLGSPALSLYNYGNAILSSAGETKKPLKYLSFAGVINVLLNLIFVIGLNMSAAGVALASIIAEYISTILIIKELISTDKIYSLRPASLSLNREIALRILKIGIPAAIQYSLFAIANLFIQASVNTFDHITVEGNSAAINADPIVYNMMYAFYVACSSFIAQNYGAKKQDRVLKSYLITTVYSFGIGLVLGVLLFIFKSQFLFVFTSDPDVIAQGIRRLNVMALSYCVSSFMDNSIAASRGLGKTSVPTAIVVSGTIGFRIIWVFTVFVYFKTLEALLLTYLCSWIFTAILGNIYFFKQYKLVFNAKHLF